MIDKPDNLEFWKTVLISNDIGKFIVYGSDSQEEIIRGILSYLKEKEPKYFNKIKGNSILKNIKIPLKKILIVEDEPGDILLMKEVISKFNVNIMVAVNGIKALEIVKKDEPQLIFLDLMLPKMDGYKVCGFLKNDRRYRHIPIIICTARVDKNEIKICMDLGADYIIHKPIEVTEIDKLIIKYLKLNYKDFN